MSIRLECFEYDQTFLRFFIDNKLLPVTDAYFSIEVLQYRDSTALPLIWKKLHVWYSSSSLGPIFNFLSTIITTTILINACHFCNIQVCANWFELKIIFIRIMQNPIFCQPEIRIDQEYWEIVILVGRQSKITFW